MVWLAISYKSRLTLVIRWETLNSAMNVMCVNMGHECSWYTLFCNLCTYQSVYTIVHYNAPMLNVRLIVRQLKQIVRVMQFYI